MIILDLDKLPYAAKRSHWVKLIERDASTFYRAEREGRLKRSGQGRNAIYTRKEILKWLGLDKS